MLEGLDGIVEVVISLEEVGFCILILSRRVEYERCENVGENFDNIVYVFGKDNGFCL